MRVPISCVGRTGSDAASVRIRKKQGAAHAWHVGDKNKGKFRRNPPPKSQHVITLLIFILLTSIFFVVKLASRSLIVCNVFVSGVLVAVL
jgi:hypothetical protein